MKIFDAGQHATGFIAIGQMATGVIAIGQVATGVVAVGQLARGGIVLGQGAIGLVAWGMGAVGVFRSAGMVGVGGRAGLGAILPLVPSLPQHRVDPEAIPFEAIARGQEGFLSATAVPEGDAFALYAGQQRLPIKIDRPLLGSMKTVLAKGPRPIFAKVVSIDGVFVCKEIQYTPDPPHRRPGFGVLAALGVAAMIGLGIGFWPATGNDIVEAITARDGPPPKPAAPPPAPRPSKPRR